MKKVVVLFSGGLDSTTVLAHCLNQGFDVTALSFDYGQRHKKELAQAKKIAKSYGVKHHVVSLGFSWGGSALTDENIAVPTDASDGIPVTYVPGRNTIFVALALSLAEATRAKSVYLGINAVDYSGYPDCRPEYLNAFQELANLSSKVGIEGNGIKLVAPLIHKTKKEIVQMAMKLSVPIEETWSCYQGMEIPCGICDSCRIRNEALNV